MEYLVARSAGPADTADQALFTMLAHYDGLMRRFGVTGLLLAHGGQTAHYLEGRSADLILVRHALESDSFQRHVAVVQRGLALDRRFPRWQMAYAAAHPPAHPAFSPLLSDPSLPWPRALQDASELLPLRELRARALGLARERGR